MSTQTAEDDQTTLNSRMETEELRNGPQNVEEYDPLDALRGLAPGARVTVNRQTPSYAKGFLDHLTIPQSGEIDIESEIKANWGGGTYKLQPRQLSPNGKMNFGRGCVILSIAGEPMLNGRRYVGGVLEEPSAAAPAPMPYMMPNPQQTSRAGLEGQLLTMVQQTLARGQQTGTATDLAGLGTLITSMSSIMGPQQQQSGGDAMGEMDRAFSLLTKMQKLSGMSGSGNGGGQDDDSDSPFSGGLQQMLMMKLMGGGPQSPQQPQYPPQYGQQPQQNWGQQQPTQHYPPPQQYARPSQPPNWTPPPAGVPYQQPASAIPTPQPLPQPQSDAPPDPATMDGPHESQPAVDDSGPFTVSHLEAEMQHMSKPQRDAFVTELMQKLGIDEKLGSMFGGVVPAGPPNGGGQPGPGPEAPQPEVFPAQPFDMGGSFNKDG